MRRRTLKVESMVRRRRALSLALGLSFVSAPSFAQQTELPQLPELPQLQSPAPGNQLPAPYPFAGSPAPARSVSAKLVGLLGISSTQPAFPAASPLALPALPTHVAGVETQASLPSTESMVVMAAASDPRPSEAKEFAMDLPQPGEADGYEPTQVPNQSTEKELPVHASLSDPIPTDSLIDIEIPLESSTGRSAPSAPVPTVLVTEAALPALPESAPEQPKSRTPELFRPSQGRGLSLEKLQPRGGAAAKNQVVRSSRGQADSSAAVTSTSGTEPTSFRMNDDEDLSFNLSDAGDDVSANPPVALVDREKTPGKSTPAVARESLPMRVQIEGLPAPTVAAPKQMTEKSALPVRPQTPANRLVPEFETPSLMAETPVQQGRARLASLATPLDRQPTATTSLSPSEMKQGEALRVGMQDATLLSTETRVTQVSVENPQICQILQTGERSYSLVGLQPGSTRIALISSLASGERSVEIREVTVAGPQAAAASKLDGLAQGIADSLEQIYPQYAIDIDVVDRSLLVQGEVASEAEAKRIIAFVRKASLTPVIDKLKSQEQ